MGMLSRFISGAAGAGADILASQIKADAEEASAIRRAQAGADIKAASDEKVRAQMAARYAEYAKPVEGMVKGAATAVDDEGNSTAPNDFKESRDPTLREVSARALKGGDVQYAGLVESMQHKDDIIANSAERDRLRAIGLKETNATKERIATANIESREYISAEKLEKQIADAKGKMPTGFTAEINSDNSAAKAVEVRAQKLLDAAKNEFNPDEKVKLKEEADTLYRTAGQMREAASKKIHNRLYGDNKPEPTATADVSGGTASLMKTKTVPPAAALQQYLDGLKK